MANYLTSIMFFKRINAKSFFKGAVDIQIIRSSKSLCAITEAHDALRIKPSNAHPNSSKRIQTRPKQCEKNSDCASSCRT